MSGTPAAEELTLATAQQIDEFLKGAERRAYRQAMFTLREQEIALDAVQDAMMKLTEKYSGRPIEEFPMLFQRILQNVMRDFFRRQKVRSLWTTLLSNLGGNKEEDDDQDPLETMEVDSEGKPDATPHGQFEQKQVMGIIQAAIEALPTRQREAFLLRYWEELDVAETAAAMGCSEGSVKTHCSRAVHALAGALKAKGVSL